MNNKPEIFTFGIAKYVYASAYDLLETENKRLKKDVADANKGAKRNMTVAKLAEQRVAPLESENKRLRDQLKHANGKLSEAFDKLDELGEMIREIK